MKLSQLKQIIKEEISNALNKTETSPKYYYMRFTGKDQPVGPSSTDRGPLNSKRDVLKIDGFPGMKEIATIHKVRVDRYVVYVLTSKDKRDRWCVVTPFDAKFNASVTSGTDAYYRYSYKIVFDAIKKAIQDPETPTITYEEFLS